MKILQTQQQQQENKQQQLQPKPLNPRKYVKKEKRKECNNNFYVYRFLFYIFYTHIYYMKNRIYI